LPVSQGSGVAWRRLGSPASLPEVPPDRVLPGVSCPPVGPWDRGSPPGRPGASGSRPSGRGSATTAHRPSRGRSVLPLPPRDLAALLLLGVPLAVRHKARVRGWRCLAAPGVFPSTVGTPPPASTQGDPWRSHVPARPLCRPAPLSAPGGVRRTRLWRTQACCLPALARRRRFPRYR
jgi:hypothetical protein